MQQDGILRFEINFTIHGWMRAGARRISRDAIRAALLYGRSWSSRGCVVHLLDGKSLAAANKDNLDLSCHLGVTVVATPQDHVVTAYRQTVVQRRRAA